MTVVDSRMTVPITHDALRRVVRQVRRGAEKKQRINPMLLDMHQALRCHARSKRSGLRCQAPAVQGSSVCRMHGAGGGAPRGNRNALKHGLYTAKAIEMRRMVAALTRQARELVALA
jgi:glucans biosynthesis protein